MKKTNKRTNIMMYFLFSLGLLLAGCIESDKPLSPPAALAPGDPLIGDWIKEESGTTTYLHIGNGDGQGKWISVERKDDGSITSESGGLVVTILNGKTYLSMDISNAPPANYILLQYRIADNKQLILKGGNIPFVAQAIEHGLIAGTAHQQSLVPNVALSADSEALQRFVTQYEKQIFTEDLATFHRAQ